MLYDAMFEFSDGQTITTTAVADYYLDMQSSDLEMGAGTPLFINVKVGSTAFTTGGDNDGTLVVSVVYEGTDPVDTSSTVLFSTVAWAEADLTAGTTVMSMALPSDFDKERYVGLLYTTANDVTGGTLDAWLSTEAIGSAYDTQVDESNI